MIHLYAKKLKTKTIVASVSGIGNSLINIMMKRTNLKSFNCLATKTLCLIAFGLFFMIQTSIAQNVNFDAEAFVDVADFGSGIYTSGNIRITLSGTNWTEQTTAGESSSQALFATAAGTQTITVETIDGNELDFQSFYTEEYGAFQIVGAEGFKDAGSTGTQTTGFPTSTTATVTLSNAIFDDVDQMVITSHASGFSSVFDSFVFGPAAFTTGSVITTGGTVLGGKWNATNTGVDISVPIGNNANIDGGTIQIRGQVDAGTFEGLGSAATILTVNLNGTQTVSITAAELEALGSFAEGSIITLNAIITDLSTNATTGTVSSTTLTVDQLAPTNENTVYAGSSTEQSGVAVTIVSSVDVTNEVWFAPTSTSSFVAGSTMTKAASGTATSILSPVTEGSYKLYVIDAAGNVSSESTATLTVDNIAPSISTAAANALGSTIATMNGNITADGGASITARGFVYSLTSFDATPTIAEIAGTDVIQVVEGGTATGTFLSAITGLTVAADYSYISYATNSQGTTEGSVQTFSTLPIVVINEVVTAHLQDWSTNGFINPAGNSFITNGTDEWIEIYVGTAGIDFLNGSGWTIEVQNDNGSARFDGDLTISGAFGVVNYIGAGTISNSAVGDYIILGDAIGGNSMVNDVDILIKNESGVVIDQVDIGTGTSTGNPSSFADESVHRLPNASDTNVDGTDFSQGFTTLGYSNSTPIIGNATWSDQNADGSIDRVVLTFNQNMEIVDGDGGDGFGAIMIDNSGAVTIDDFDYAGSGQSSLTLNFTGVNQISGTDISGLTITYSSAGANSIKATTGAIEISDGNITVLGGTNTDIAIPTFTSAWLDNSGNGNIDKLRLDFSEAISFSDGDAGTGIFDAITITGGIAITNSIDFSTVTGVMTYTFDVSGVTGTSSPSETIAYATGGQNTITDDGGSQEMINTANPTAVTDEAAPVLVAASSSPLDNATGVALSSNVVLTFSENIQAGTGNISILDVGSTDDRVITIPDAQLVFSTNTVTINPSTNLLTNSNNYSVNVDATAIDDQASPVNSYAGFADNTTMDFTTTLASPTINNAHQFDTNGDGNIDEIVIELSEEVDEATSEIGDFTLGAGTVDAVSTILSTNVANTLDVTDADQYVTLEVTVTGTAAVTVAYAKALAAGVQLTGVTSGLEADDTPVVTTVDSADPVLVAASSTPLDNAVGVDLGTNIVLTFSEVIQAGTGNISIIDVGGTGTDDRVITLPNAQLVFSTNTLTINPSTDLLTENNNYAVNVDATAIDDQASPVNSYVGIGDNTTMNFTTNNSPVTTFPGTQSTDGTTSVTFTAGTVISIADGDSDNQSVNVTVVNNGDFTASTGTITATQSGAAVVGGSGSATLTISGTLADINGTLDGMAYVPGSVAGQHEITIATDDGNGGTDSDVVLVNVSGTYTLTVTTDNAGSPEIGSLRAAIGDAILASGSADIIDATGIAGTIGLTGDLPSITGGLTINGPGVSNLTIDGNTNALFESSGGDFTVTGFTITDGLAANGGAVFFNDVTSTFTATGMHFDTNTATTNGGAVHIQQGIGNISQCLFTSNTGDNGGAIYASLVNQLNVTNSTFTGNSATAGSGGAIVEAGSGTNLDHVTIIGNTASGNGDGIIANSTITINYCIIYNNGTEDVNQSGGTVDAENTQNIVGTISGSILNSGNVTDGSTDFSFSALADNGGETQTMFISGTEAVAAAVGSAETVDQIGNTRNGNPYNDLGALEVAPGILNAYFFDVNPVDGVIDEVVIELTEQVDETTALNTDFTISSGSLSAAVLTAGASNTLDISDSDEYVTFPITAYGLQTAVPTISYIAGTLTNEGGASANSNGSITLKDNASPNLTSIVRQTPSTTPTNADALIWRFTFTELVSNLTSDDFTLTNSTATVTSISDETGGVYDITVSGGDLAGLNATPTISVAVSDIADAAGNALSSGTPTGTNDNSFVVDNINPTVTDLEIFDSDDDGFVDRIDITFSENIDTDNAAAPVFTDLGTLLLPDGSAVVTTNATPSITDTDGTFSVVSVTGISTLDHLVGENTAAGSTAIDGLTGLWADNAGNGILAAGDDAETITDSANPYLLSSTPPDESLSFDPTANIVLSFTESVLLATGNILLNDITNGGAFETFDVGIPDVIQSDNTITINPTTDLNIPDNYAVRIAATAVDDADGNSYGGIVNDTDLNFTANNISPPECTGYDYIAAGGSTSDSDGHLSPSNCNNELASVSSLADTQIEALSVFYFNITNPSTTGQEDFTTILFRNGNTTVDWANVIAGAELINEAGSSKGHTSITSTTISFTSITDSSPGDLGYIDNSTDEPDGIEYALRIWFNSTIPTADAAIIDNEYLIFELQLGDFTESKVESILNPATGLWAVSNTIDISSGATNNQIQVTATQYTFADQPTTTDQNSVMAPAVTLGATDLNGNRDLDYGVTETVTITSTGTVLPAPSLLSFTAGLGTVSDVIHRAGGAGLTLGTTGGALTAAAASSTFTINPDVTPPTVTSVTPNITGTISDSDVGAGNFTVAVLYNESLDAVTHPTLTFTADVSGTGTGTITFTGGAWSNNVNTNDTYTATYTVADVNETVSLVDIGVNGAVDNAGANTQTVSADHADEFSIDTQNPSAFTVGTVTTQGAPVVAGYWNLNNTSIDVVVPVANDASLTGGTIQVRANVASGGFENLGGIHTILVGELMTNVTLNFTDATFEALSATLAEGESIVFTAVIVDTHGNTSTGTNSSQAIVVDRVGPTVSDMDIYDTNNDGFINQIILTFNENVDTDNGSIPVFADLGTLILPDGSTLTTSGGVGITDPAGVAATVTISNIAVADHATNIGVTANGSTSIDGLTGLWSDVAGNTLVAAGDDAETVTDSAAPVIASTSTFDADLDGQIDGMTVTLTENLADASSTFDATTFDVLSGFVGELAVTGTGNDNLITLTFTESGSADSDATPNIDLNIGKLSDGTTTSAATQNFTGTKDGAGPAAIATLTLDTNGDGIIDEMEIEFSEPVTDGDFTVAAIADWTLDEGNGVEVFTGFDTEVTDLAADATTNDKYVTLLISTGLAIDTEVLSYAYTNNGGDDINDALTNKIADRGTTASADGAGAIIVNSISLDNNGDGNTETIELEMSETISDFTFLLAIADWSVSSDNFSAGAPNEDDVITTLSTEVSSLTAANVIDDKYVTISWTPINTIGTGVCHVKYTNSGKNIIDKSARANVISTFLSNYAATDGALPIFHSTETNDNDGNGYIDEIIVRFSDPVDVAGTLDEDPTGGFDDFSVVGYTITAVTPVAGAGLDDNEIILKVTELGAYDTGATPDVTVVGTQINDTGGNTVPGNTLTTSDLSLPVYISSTTKDTDNNGQIDRIAVLFSEPVDATTIDEISAGGFDDFAVAGYTITAVTPVAGTGVNDNDINLTITESGSNDTGAIPNVTVNATQINDVSGNTVATGMKAAIDGVTPLIASAIWEDNNANGNIDQVVLTFSEPVDITDAHANAATDGFDGIFINDGGPVTLDGFDYSTTNATSMTITFLGDEITGNGISGVTATYDNSSTDMLIDETGTSNNEIANGLAATANTDNATPLTTSVSIASNNGTSTNRAKDGDVVTLTFSLNDDLTTDPTVTFSSGGTAVQGTVTLNTGSAPTYTATYVVDGTGSSPGFDRDVDGAVTFTIDFTDDASNAGVQVTAVSDATSITVDTTAPTVTVTRDAVTNGSFTSTNDASVAYSIVFSENIDNNASEFTFATDVTESSTGITTTPGLAETIATSDYTLTFGITSGDGDLSFTLLHNGTAPLTDLAGNAMTGSVVSDVITIDNTLPTVALTRNAVTSGSFTGTKDNSISYDIAFSTVINNGTFVLGDVTIINPSGVTLGTAVLTPDGDNQNYTYTLPITSGDGLLSISMAPSSIADAATNGLAALVTSSTIEIDNTVPVTSNVTITSNNGTNTDRGITSNTVTLSFTVNDDLTSNPVVAFNSGGAVVNGGVTIGGSNPNYTASYVVSGTDTDGAVTFTIDFTDDARNAATQITAVSGTGSATSVTVDNTAPTVTITRDAVSNGSFTSTNDASVAYSIVFSENIDNNASEFTFATDVTESSTGIATTPGLAETIATSDYTLTFGITSGDGDLSFTLLHNGTAPITDLAGNTMTGSVVSDIITIDNTLPTVALTRNAVTSGSFTGTKDNSVSFDIAFSTAINNGTFVLGDVTIINPSSVTLGTAVLTPDGDNQNYTYTLPVTSRDGLLSISMAASSIADAATNGLAALVTSSTIEIDNTLPTTTAVTLITNNITNTDKAITGNTVTLDFTVNDDLTSTPTVSFKSGNANINNAVSVGVNGGHPNYRATYAVNALDVDGAVTFSINFTDDAGNVVAAPITAVTNASTVTIDNTAPTVTITRDAVTNGSFTSTNDASVAYSIVFSENIQISSLTATDFIESSTGVTTTPVFTEDIATTDYSLTIGITSGDGDLSFTLLHNEATPITDLAGNAMTASVVSDVITIDNTLPTMLSAVDNNGSTSITVVFSENMQISNLTATDFIVTDQQATNYAVGNVTDGTANDNELTLTVANYSASVGDLTITHTKSTGIFDDLAKNALVTDGTGVQIERTLLNKPITAELALASTNTGDTDTDVALFRSTTDPSALLPVKITPNINNSTIKIYRDAGLTDQVGTDYTNVTTATGLSPTVAQFMADDITAWVDATADHGVYTFYITETAVNNTDSEGPATIYSLAFLDDITNDNGLSFSQDNTSGTTLSIVNHPASNQTLAYVGNGLTDFSYNPNGTSTSRFVPVAAGVGITKISLTWENNTSGVNANFKDVESITVTASSVVFKTSQKLNFCQDEAISILDINDAPTDVDVDGTDTANPDFFGLEIYYIENGEIKTSLGVAGVENATGGNIASTVLTYDGASSTGGDDQIAIAAGTPSFTAGEWQFDPSAFKAAGFSTTEIDTLRFAYINASDDGSTFSRNSLKDVYLFPEPVLTIKSVDDYYTEDDNSTNSSTVTIQVDVVTYTGNTSDGQSNITNGYKLYKETTTGSNTYSLYKDFTAPVVNTFEPEDPDQDADKTEDETGKYRIEYTSLEKTDGNCTSTKTFDFEVLSKPELPTIVETDFGAIGTKSGNDYLFEYCGGSTVLSLSATTSSNTLEKFKWFTDVNGSNEITTSNVSGTKDETINILEELFGGVTPTARQSRTIYLAKLDHVAINSSSFAGTRSDLSKVTIEVYDIPSQPTVNTALINSATTNTTNLGGINVSETNVGTIGYTYEYCAASGANATLSDLVMTSGLNTEVSTESYFTIYNSDATTVITTVTTTTITGSGTAPTLESILSYIPVATASTGTSKVFYISRTDFNNNFPTDTSAPFSGCEGVRTKFTIDVNPIPDAPVIADFGGGTNTDSYHEFNSAVQYYLCSGDGSTTNSGADVAIFQQIESPGVTGSNYTWYTDDGTETAPSTTKMTAAAFNDRLITVDELKAEGAFNDIAATETTYTYWVTQSTEINESTGFLGCESAATKILITVYPDPSVLTFVTNSTKTLSINNCEQDWSSVSFAMTGNANASYQYYVSDAAGTIQSAATSLFNGNVQTSASVTITSEALFLTNATQGTQYYLISQTNNIKPNSSTFAGCESELANMAFLTVRIFDIPAAPKENTAGASDNGLTDFYRCFNEIGLTNQNTLTIPDITIKGEAGATFNWYDVATGGTAVYVGATASEANLNLSSTSAEGDYVYYVSQTQTDAVSGFTGCESERLTVTVHVKGVPDTPDFASSISTSICDNAEAIPTFDADGVAGAQFRWYTGTSTFIQSNTTGQFTPNNSAAIAAADIEGALDTFAGLHTFFATQVTDSLISGSTFVGCESPTRQHDFTIHNIPSAPTVIGKDVSGNSVTLNTHEYCATQDAIAEMSITTPVTNQTYEWYVSSTIIAANKIINTNTSTTDGSTINVDDHNTYPTVLSTTDQTVSYFVISVEDGCNSSQRSDITQADVILRPLPVLSVTSTLNAAYCIDGAVTEIEISNQGANISDGSQGLFSGTGLTFNAFDSTATVDLRTAVGETDSNSKFLDGNATYSFSYTHTDVTGCTTIINPSFEINGLPSLVFNGSFGGDEKDTVNFPIKIGATKFTTISSFNNGSDIELCDDEGQFQISGQSGSFYKLISSNNVSDDLGVASGIHNFIPSDHPFDANKEFEIFTLLNEYTDANGCFNSIQNNITIHRKPEVSILFDDGCSGESLIMHADTIPNTAFNESDITYSWDFGDLASQTDKGFGQDTLYNYILGEGILSKSFSPTMYATSPFGCISDVVNKPVAITVSPALTFRWDSVIVKRKTYFTAAEIVLTTDVMKSIIFDFGDGIILDSLITDLKSSSNKVFNSVEHTYQNPGLYSVKVKLETNNGCIDSLRRDVNVVPLVTQLPYEIDFDGFDTQTINEAGWYAETLKPNALQDSTELEQSWWFGTAKGGNFDVANSQLGNKLSGNNYWSTTNYLQDTANMVYGYRPVEKSWIYSPAFDISAMSRPMLTFNSAYSFEDNKDGVAVQYSTNNGESWKVLGNFDSDVDNSATGLQWYNGDNVQGDPGNQTAAINDNAPNSVGWTSLVTTPTWVNSRHKLDGIGISDEGKKRLRFRFSIGVQGTNPGQPGFAFDDFKIVEREKNVLLEMFSSTKSAASNTVSDFITDTLNNVAINNGDVSVINYHTSIYNNTTDGNDEFNAVNELDPNARVSYYGVNQITSFLDGDVTVTEGKAENVIPWTANDLSKSSLELPSFNVTFETGDVGGSENIDVDITFTARENFGVGTKLLLHAAIIEKTVVGVSNGAIISRNVLRKMLEDGAGQLVEVTTQLDSGSVVSYTDLQDVSHSTFKAAWTIKNVEEPNNLSIVGFIQNKDNNEIYQSNSLDITGKLLVTGINDNELSMDTKLSLYPNPADGKVTIVYPQKSSEDLQWVVYDQSGRIFERGSTTQGFEGFELDTFNFPNGLYYITVQGKNIQYQNKKLMVIH